ncbi:LysR family transcriptional regulator [Xylophilus rhododendri]|uniref:LysR family transcriptional regulator n=1 Tax=Xylophilus rhododendri TaxID=2697032 RepID=A0A857JCP1_9BURK|nr:LysR family transcriptional regulator [Xylophilus rhododendri]QHJ00962.1 LysR family transcriptional regulator [Xylophilus rhododendri]
MVRFDISDLRIFVNVVQAGSITLGAERSHRAAASISARIKEMELEMGAPLLMRARSGVVPTEAGRKLLEHGFRLLNEVQRMNDDLAEYGNRARSFIKLHCNTVSLYEYLQKPVSAYLLQNPGTALTIEELVNHQIPQAVLDGSADIGVVADPVDTKGLETIPFVLDRYVMISSKRVAPLVGRRFVDFLDSEFVGPGRGSWMHTMLQQHAAEAGKPLRYSVQLRSFSMTCQLVADGVGIGIVPASAAERMQAQVPLRITELEDSWAQLPLKFCVRKRAELSRQSAALLDFLLSQDQGQKARLRSV